MGAVYEQIEQGNLKEDEKLSRSISYLNSKFGISPENAEQTTGGISLTVNQALNQMITISHNYAAMLLTEKIKLSTTASYLKSQGFNNSRVGTGGDDPLTTASDIGSFFEKLYNNELATPESNQKMLDFLKKQQKNNKLPLYTPQDVVMAHKTGELGMFSHDAGIVYTPKGDYIIVAMSESPSPKGAEDRIALVSKAVYEYFMSR
jgi:beta-lactamase class A